LVGIWLICFIVLNYYENSCENKDDKTYQGRKVGLRLENRDDIFTEFFRKINYTIPKRVDGEVLAGFGAGAGVESGADLADNDLSSFYFLTAKGLNSPPLTGSIGFLVGFSL